MAYGVEIVMVDVAHKYAQFQLLDQKVPNKVDTRFIVELKMKMAML